MSKPTVRKSPSVAQPKAKRSGADDLAIFRSVVATLKNDPEKLRSVVTKAGITTAAGNLKKAYRG